MKKILFLFVCVNLSGCGVAQVATSVVYSPYDTAGKIVASGFEAARPNQGTEYSYPYQNPQK